MKSLSRSIVLALLLVTSPRLLAQAGGPIPMSLGDTLLSTLSQPSWPVRMKADGLGNKSLLCVENWNGHNGHEIVLRILKFDPTATTRIYSDVLIDEAAFVNVDIAVAADGTAYVIHEDSISKVTAAGSLVLNWAALNFVGRAIEIDSLSNLYVSGERNGDAVWAKVDSSGNMILTQSLTGSGLDYASAVALSPSATTLILVGRTDSSDFQTLAAIQPTFGGGSDAFIARFDTSSGALLSSTYLGGSGFDEAHAVKVSSNGDIAVAGETDSANFPIATALQPTPAGGRDAFVTRTNPTSSALMYSSYLGGTGDEQAFGVSIDAVSNMTITGVTYSTDFPLVRSAVTTREGHWQAFLSRVDHTGAAYQFSTYQSGGSNFFFVGFDLVDDPLNGLFMAANANSYSGGGSSNGRVRRFSPYQTIPLFDTSKQSKQDPLIQIQLQDLLGVNRSSTGLVVTTGYVTARGDPSDVRKTLTGSFIFDRNLQYGHSVKGGYKYTLDRTGLPAGDYDLIFYVGSPSIFGTVSFSLK